jgi:hypothetical protein
MGIATDKRIHDKLQELDALIDLVRVLSESLSRAEARIAVLEQQPEKRGPGRPRKYGD